MKTRHLTVYGLLFTLLGCAEAEKVGESLPPETTTADDADETQTAEQEGGTAAKSKVAVIVGTDFKGSGAVQALTLGAATDSLSLSGPLAVVSDDPIIRAFGSRVYVVNRFGADNIQVLDPNANYTTAAQYSVGNGSNPHDIIEISPDKAYVSRYHHTFNDVLIVHPSTGEELGSIALDGLTGLNTEKMARPHAFARGGNRVFLTLQNITSDYSTTEEGLVAVIDPATDTLIDADPSTPEIDPIRLGLKNPEVLVAFGRTLFLITSGSFTSADQATEAGLIRLDPETYAIQILFTGKQAGGRPTALALSSDTKGYVSIESFDFPSTFSPRVLTFNPQSGTVGTDAYTATDPSSSIPGMAVDSFGFLHILDRYPQRPGVIVLDTRTDSVVMDRFQTTLPPSGIAIVTE